MKKYSEIRKKALEGETLFRILIGGEWHQEHEDGGGSILDRISCEAVLQEAVRQGPIR